MWSHRTQVSGQIGVGFGGAGGWKEKLRLKPTKKREWNSIVSRLTIHGFFSARMSWVLLYANTPQRGMRRALRIVVSYCLQNYSFI